MPCGPTQAAVHISADWAGEAGEMVHSLARLRERGVLVGNPGTQQQKREAGEIPFSCPLFSFLQISHLLKKEISF